MVHKKMTSVNIYRSDLEYLEDLQYKIRKNLKKDLSKYTLLNKILEFIKAKEEEFFNWLYQNLE